MLYPAELLSNKPNLETFRRYVGNRDILYVNFNDVLRKRRVYCTNSFKFVNYPINENFGDTYI